jgi:hypothetical protein
MPLPPCIFLDPGHFVISDSLLKQTNPLNSLSVMQDRHGEMLETEIERVTHYEVPILVWVSSLSNPARFARLTRLETTSPDAWSRIILAVSQQILNAFPDIFSGFSGRILSHDEKGLLSIPPSSQSETAPAVRELAGCLSRQLRQKSVWWQIDRLVEGDDDSAWETPDTGDRIRVPSKRYVSKWLNMKQLLAKPAIAFFLAYEMGAILTNGYTDDVDDIDVIASSNNTGLVLASHLSQILSKPLMIIDHLGPVSRLVSGRLPAAFETRICLVEEVVATGREADLANLYLQLRGATLEYILIAAKIGLALPDAALSAKVRFLSFFDDTIVPERQPERQDD